MIYFESRSALFMRLSVRDLVLSCKRKMLLLRKNHINHENTSYLRRSRRKGHVLIVFGLLDRISVGYGNEKGPPLSEAVPLCGQWDNYRTNFNRLHFVTSSLPSFNLPRRQKNGILCVLCVNVASFWAKTAYSLAASTYNRPSTVFWLSMRQSETRWESFSPHEKGASRRPAEGVSLPQAPRRRAKTY